MTQPELLSRELAFHRSLIQRGQHVLAERVKGLLQAIGERRVSRQRLPELIDRQAELLAGRRGARPFVQPIQHGLLLVRRESHGRQHDIAGGFASALPTRKDAQLRCSRRSRRITRRRSGLPDCRR